MGGDKIEKITIMVLKVDLQCSSSYKKVKKVLGKFPQIRDQVYDEKANSVTIKVFCCNPEKIRDKLCCKGGGVIKSIEIKEPPKPKEPKKPIVPEPTKPIVPEPKKPSKPTPASTPVAPPSQPQVPPVFVMQIQGYPHQYPPASQPVILMPIQGYPHQTSPGGYCCDECYQGNSGGPCYHHERPIQPPPPSRCYSYGYGHPKGCYVNKCDYYFSEENASGCSIM